MGAASGSLQGLQRQGTHLSLGLLAVAGVCNLLTESWRLYVQHDLARLGKEAAEPFRLMIERIVEGSHE
jgi:hypothetical protein